MTGLKKSINRFFLGVKLSVLSHRETCRGSNPLPLTNDIFFIFIFWCWLWEEDLIVLILFGGVSAQAYFNISCI